MIRESAPESSSCIKSFHLTLGNVSRRHDFVIKRTFKPGVGNPFRLWAGLTYYYESIVVQQVMVWHYDPVTTTCFPSGCTGKVHIAAALPCSSMGTVSTAGTYSTGSRGEQLLPKPTPSSSPTIAGTSSDSRHSPCVTIQKSSSAGYFSRAATGKSGGRSSWVLEPAGLPASDPN